jgi:hypothetical protein
MNKHLNLFTSYSRDDRNYQLENDLTRALAISLQEDKLLLHEVLKNIFIGTRFYNTLFDEFSKDNRVNIEIQKEVSSLEEFEHVFAVSLTSSMMNVDSFFSKTHHAAYDPICDLVITINSIVIIVEVKRDSTDCTNQLYNQIYNALKDTGIENITSNEPVTPVDLNWHKLMELVVNVNNYHKNTNTNNRYLEDFIQYVREHNYNWLPEVSISSLNADNKNAIFKRVKTAISNSEIPNLTSDRIGFKFPQPYADELIYDITDNGDLVIILYPANTKSQGYHVFNNKDVPVFKSELTIAGSSYAVHKGYHIKLSSFQRYFTGLWFSDSNLKQGLYNKSNFHKFSGRKKRGNDWSEIEKLFDNSFNESYDWRAYSKWNTKVLQAGKNQFDISFGYELSIRIPFKVLKEIDTKKEDINNLKVLLENIHHELLDVIK